MLPVRYPRLVTCCRSPSAVLESLQGLLEGTAELGWASKTGFPTLTLVLLLPYCAVFGKASTASVAFAIFLVLGIEPLFKFEMESLSHLAGLTLLILLPQPPRVLGFTDMYHHLGLCSFSKLTALPVLTP